MLDACLTLFLVRLLLLQKPTQKRPLLPVHLLYRQAPSLSVRL